MLQFNELTVTQDNRRLIIDTQVLILDYYENVYIDSIIIDTYDNFMEAGPSSKSIIAYKAEEDENIKHKRICYDVDGIGANMLYFVYVISKGEKSAEAPCGCGRPIIIGVAYNKYPIYKSYMYNIKALDGCNPSNEFINNLLRFKAFEYALNAGNFPLAIQYWKRFFTNTQTTIKPHNCGCNGRI